MVPGWSLHGELAWLAEAGIPNDELVRMATADAAEWLGIGDTVGTLEAGKVADLVVLGADPLADIANVGEVEAVVQAGVVLDRSALVDL